MNDRIPPHWSFWLIAAIALIWNVLGSVNFFMQMNPDNMDMYREVERAIIQSRPMWATAAFAISVFAGAIGGLLLFLRKPFAFHAFVVSLAGAVATTIHTVGVDAEFSTSELIVMAAMPIVVAGLFAAYARYARGKSWVAS